MKATNDMIRRDLISDIEWLEERLRAGECSEDDLIALKEFKDKLAHLDVDGQKELSL